MMAQLTLSIAGKRFTAKQVWNLIDENNKVTIGLYEFDVTYRTDENNMFETVKKEDAKYFLLWGRGYKYALSFLKP